jgi:predicted MFS family arabinose efflux permease
MSRGRQKFSVGLMDRSTQSEHAPSHRPRHTALLFLALFAAQAAYLVLVSTLPQVGQEFHVRPEIAGQLGGFSGLSGLVIALWIARRTGSVGVARLLATGTLLLVVGCLCAALANSFVAIAAVQCLVGGSMAAVAAAGTAAALAWPSPEQRAGVLAWSLLGPPAAWILGSPLIGGIADRDWRAAWLLPLGLGVIVLAGLAAGGQPREAEAAVDRLQAISWRPLRRWVAGELLAFTGWNAVLTYASTLLVEVHGFSPRSVGLLLAATVLGYFPSTLLARRYADAHADVMLIGLALAAIPVALALGLFRGQVWLTALLLTALAAINGARGLAGSVRGQQHAPEYPMPVAGARVAILQGAGILGAAVGGAALAIGGWTLFGVAIGAAYVCSAWVQRSVPGGAPRVGRSRIGSAVGNYGNPADVGAQARI